MLGKLIVARIPALDRENMRRIYPSPPAMQTEPHRPKAKDL
jgi:hypothetical protein